MPPLVAAHDPGWPPTPSDAFARMIEAEDTLRAIGAGEVDALVVSDGDAGQRVFTLSTADRPYRMFVEHMRDGAATISPDGLILYANRRMSELLSCSRERIVGSPLAAFLSTRSAVGLDEVRGPSGRGATFDLELVDAAGVAIPVHVGSWTLDLDGEPLICMTFTDLSAQRAQDREIARLGEAQAERLADLQEAQAALTRQATHDELTGLPNRALLVDRIDQALSHARRSGRCTAVLFVDLDRFKQVNDTHGHAAGDTVLRVVAEKLAAIIRPTDTVARIGGDEFVVLATNVDSQLHAADLSNRIVAEVCRRPDYSEDGERLAASIGIAVSVGGRGSAETLLAEADTAMYQAKSRGGGRAEVFDAALGRAVQQRAVALRMLQSALDEHRIVAHYQPIIDLAAGTVAGFEALARISDRNGLLVAPGDFIPVAEDSGLVVPLGAQVLAMACTHAAGWRADVAGARALTIAVNVSARQLQAGDLTTLVHETLERTGLDPACLHLEITETAIIDLHPGVVQQLTRIGDLGVEIGLDDFGTGYASLTHLRRLPLSFVKIDRSFVCGSGTNKEDDRIVSAVIDLAANLGLRSIAEGIETTHQLERLRALGCDQGQGFHFSRPLAPGDVPAAIGHPPW